MYKYQAGFSYMEVLVAGFLISILLLPGLEALNSGIQSGESFVDLTREHHRLLSKMELMLNKPFTELIQAADAVAGPTTIVERYADAADEEHRHLVYLARYDGDNADGDDDPFTGADASLIWIKVQIEATPYAIESLVSH